jgi:hypothetical protein
VNIENTKIDNFRASSIENKSVGEMFMKRAMCRAQRVRRRNKREVVKIFVAVIVFYALLAAMSMAGK